MTWNIKNNKSKEKMNSIKNYSTNAKKNKNVINNIPKNYILNYSENISKNENNEGPIVIIKNKLEKILLNQNNTIEILLEKIKSSIIRPKISQSIIQINAPQIPFLINKSLLSGHKNGKISSNSEINSNKLICVQKQNQNDCKNGKIFKVTHS